MTEQCSGLAAEGLGPNPYVFILGSPRSGTTLLQRIVDANSQIAIVPESEWIAQYYNKRIGLTPEGVVTREIVPRLLEHPKFHRLGASVHDLEALLDGSGPLAYSRFVSGLFDHFGRTQGKPLAGDKTPIYARQIGVLHRLWPRAKFVHLIRDGRDVCLSVLDWKRKAVRMGELFATWVEDPVTTAALCWERDVGQSRERGRLVASALYYEIRYESLVARPVEEVQRLCRFLGVPYEEAMLDFHNGRTRSEPGLSPKEAWLPITPGLRDWRSQMHRGDVERFEAAAGSLLEELGYPRGCPSPSAAVQERAARLRARFERGLSARRQNIPLGAESHTRGDE
jgi:hypothetical protein